MKRSRTLLAISILLLTEEITGYFIDVVPDYKEAIRLSLLFFEAQRSGKLPNNNRIKWRGDSAMNDRGVRGEDLTGGYYDANDFVKYGFTMTFTTTILCWGVILYQDAYEEAGQYEEVKEAIRWATDYFMKTHSSKYEFYAQVGDFAIDHAFWGRPEDMNLTRPAYKIDEEHPGSDLAGEASAVFSAASIVFKASDEEYSEKLLQHGKELYEFATRYRGLYKDVIPGAKQYFNESISDLDELAWAAVWLYKATNEFQYLQEAGEYYKELRNTEEVSYKFFYNKKTVGVEVLLAEATGHGSYFSSAVDFCDYNVHSQTRTAKGLVFIDKYGTLGYAANIAFICLRVAELPGMPKQKYIHFAKEQIDYMLGASGRSFLIGYSQNYPRKPYHSASSCPDRPQPCGWERYNATEPNPHVLYGALVSGPDQNDHYVDSREEYLYNDVALDYNAGFQSAVAGLLHFQMKGML